MLGNQQPGEGEPNLEIEPKKHHMAKVYTREGVLLCQVYSRMCLGFQCELVYSGEEDCLFFNQKGVGTGDEILWDFVNLVKGGHMSFSRFTSHMTRLYQTTHCESAPFMSRTTWLNVFMAWITSFQIDFRDEIDPWCGHNPKILAGDGTHIGVSVRLMKLDHPVTQPDNDTTKVPSHKRHQRVFLPIPMEREKGEKVSEFDERKKCIKQARLYLLNRCRNVVGCQGVPVSGPEEEVGRKLFNDVMDGYDCAPVYSFLTSFLDREFPSDLLIAAAKMMTLMLGDGALSAILPCKYHNIILESCDAVLSDGMSAPLLRKMSTIGLEVSNFLKKAHQHNQSQLCVDFMRVLVQQAKEHHQETPPEACPIPGSYDPPSGTCYYFTEHGHQVREMPQYSVQGEGKVFDTKPEFGGVCEKLYPQVSYGGYGYMFLMFCPLHGHCYGFHLVAGGEGRKDPFSAMFKYMEEPPHEVFYDFACQLSEFCLNREPGFFRCTRFWHDLFHGITHVCGDCFKSTRVCGMESLNTEICEQFNSYMQSVKFTGSHLTQLHFVLLVQFFIYLWNREKTKTYKKIASIAIGGTL